jgi:hypothetical protein
MLVPKGLVDSGDGFTNDREISFDGMPGFKIGLVMLKRHSLSKRPYTANGIGNILQ